jgi:hypothetical protein
MKKLLLLLVFALSLHLASAQVIRGRVLDQETKVPVDFASVFFNGTFHGTTTDENGVFELDVTPYADRTLQISAVGYKTFSLNSLTADKLNEVFLEKALYEIAEVSIESESLAKERERCMRIFKNEFLGRSTNAQNCRIMNEEALTFNYHSNKDTLRATARQPLVIVNNSLGYQITYFLDKFEYIRDFKTTAFYGNIIFNLDLAGSGDNRKKIEKIRKKTYAGSCKHFFTALWLDRLNAEGFYLQKVEGYYPLEYTEFVQEDYQGKKYFAYHEDLEIAYDRFLTTVSFRDYRVFFGKDGFFEPEAILWYGYMAMARIGDWLPYEYSPGH